MPVSADGSPMGVGRILAVAALAVAIYLPTLSMGFVWDDLSHIVENDVVQDLSNVPLMVISGDGLATGESNPYYRPLPNLSVAVDYALWGENATGFHLTNILLHAVVSVLFTLLAGALTGSTRAALAAGLLFAAHPVHAEAVAYISARADLLASVFMVPSFLLYARHREADRTPLLAASLALFALSMLSKVMAITLPALVFLYEVSLRRSGWREAALRAVPFEVVAGLFMVARSVILTMEQWGGTPLGPRILTSFGIMMEYFHLLVAPYPLKVFHDVTIRTRPFDPAVIVPFLLLASCIAGLFAIRRREPLLFFSLAAVPVMLLPVSGIPDLIYPTAIAERYLYIPSIGLCLAAGIVADRIAGRLQGASRPIIAKWAGRALLVLFAALAIARSLPYRDSIAHWTRAFRDAPRSEYVLNRLAVAYSRSGRLEEAERVFRHFLERNPRDPLALTNLGVVYMRMGRTEEADALLRTAITLMPGDIRILTDLGLNAIRRGNGEEALVFLRQALEKNPYDDEMEALVGRLEQEENIAPGSGGP